MTSLPVFLSSGSITVTCPQHGRWMWPPDRADKAGEFAAQHALHTPPIAKPCPAKSRRRW